MFTKHKIVLFSYTLITQHIKLIPLLLVFISDYYAKEAKKINLLKLSTFTQNFLFYKVMKKLS